MIRKDLFAVKTYDSGLPCIERIYSRRLQRLAFDNVRFHNADLSRHFPLMEAKVVHPSQAVVDSFLAYGNTIID